MQEYRQKGAQGTTVNYSGFSLPSLKGKLRHRAVETLG